MRRLPTGASALAALVAAFVLVGGGLVPRAAAVTPDPSDVVLVFDFSASILDDVANRDRFAAALARIADRVDATAAELTAGDATVSIVQFAARAADYPTCADLKLLDSPERVGRLADCLRSVANAYRKGKTAALTKKIGVDTNYVAAMEQAARHLPADSIRPAMILFTDGKHDVRGVPVSEVQATLRRLFGARTPFALLPVGMGLRAAERNALSAGLERLRIIRDMPPCISGTTFAWPQVVFQTAADAGSAVAVALQDATCTFTAAPTPPPTPTPTPAPTPAAMHDLRATPGDGTIDLAWRPVVDAALPVVDYMARCRVGEGDWIESTEGVSLEPKTTIEGLANGTAYQCEVAAVAASGAGPWTPTAAPITPIGRPAAPPKPTVEAQNGALRLSVPAPRDGTLVVHYECSSDGGATWTAKADGGLSDPTATIGQLTNGVTYTCRAIAENTTGLSDASPLSDPVRPCNGPLDCSGLSLPIIGGLGALLVGGILTALLALYRGRTTGYVLAVVDVVHSANIGHGSALGIAFERNPTTRAVTGVVSDRGSTADVRIRRLRGGKFAVRDRSGRREVADGDPIGITDGAGGRHSLVLRAFGTNAASRVATRR